MKTNNQEKIDLEKLPIEARKEIIDFYELLLKKYKIEKNGKIDDVDIFFKNYNLDLASFKFDREKANER
ncbi:MAG: hypothetical protein ACYCTD_02830 [bacterium]